MYVSTLEPAYHNKKQHRKPTAWLLAPIQTLESLTLRPGSPIAVCTPEKRNRPGSRLRLGLESGSRADRSV